MDCFHLDIKMTLTTQYVRNISNTFDMMKYDLHPLALSSNLICWNLFGGLITDVIN